MWRLALTLSALCCLYLSSCSATGKGDTVWFKNLFPSRRFISDQEQRQRDWIASVIQQKSQAIQNEVWPWAIVAIITVVAGKVSEIVHQRRYHRHAIKGCEREIKKVINGHGKRSPGA